MRALSGCLRAVTVAAGCALSAGGSVSLSAQSDLNAFIARVLERRDDNWTKLQQFVLDEREHVELRGPSGAPIFGEQRDYTWFIRDGFFVRSPLRFNGVAIGEEERRRFEANYLKREQARAKREQERTRDSSERSSAPAPRGATDVDGILELTRQPQFISSAYFLRFKFEEGQYALVGPEAFEGRDVLRIEYYPTRLFEPETEISIGNGGGGRRERPNRRSRERGTNPEVDAAVQRLMNKGSRVTLWVEPSSHQIVRYTFDNVDLDFHPGQWLGVMKSVRASMTMGQPFPDVWLPRDLEVLVEALLAFGPINFRYSLEYHDYRRAEVTSTLRVADPQ